MINRILPIIVKIRKKWPRAADKLISIGKRWFGGRLGVYPRILGDEVSAVSKVLHGSRWNMTYGAGLPHEKLEEGFANYVGARYGVAVGSGGLALQISMRALGVIPGDEVIQQVDTCSATALAVIAAGGVPVFSDVSLDSYLLDLKSVEKMVCKTTKAIIATHMWGNPENINEINRMAAKYNIPVIEDSCLALGAKIGENYTGTIGKVGVFSFGCIKPIQGGEGGMIVTNDKDLAREMRSLRHWGDRTIEYGVRDTIVPSWNGRMSEIVAAVVLEQLKGYPKHLNHMRNAVGEFSEQLSSIPGMQIILGHARSISDCSFSQVVIKIDSGKIRTPKQSIIKTLKNAGVPVWHGNFEPISSLSLFTTGEWRKWIKTHDYERIAKNYSGPFANAQRIYTETGIGLGKSNFLSKENHRYLIKNLKNIIERDMV